MKGRTNSANWNTAILYACVTAGSVLGGVARYLVSLVVPAVSGFPVSTLIVNIGDPALVSKYAFGTRSATFHVCGRCGIVPLVTSEIDDRLYAVVNVNVLEDVDPERLRRAPMSFEGDDMASRLARRKRNWIADVRFAANNA